MAHRNRKSPHERLESFLPQIALDHPPSQRVRPVENPHFDSLPQRRLRRPDRCGCKGVVARSDIDQIDKQQVEAQERIARRTKRARLRTVERADREPRLPS